MGRKLDKGGEEDGVTEIYSSSIELNIYVRFLLCTFCRVILSNRSVDRKCRAIYV
jgi:hypothetical protein